MSSCELANDLGREDGARQDEEGRALDSWGRASVPLGKSRTVMDSLVSMMLGFFHRNCEYLGRVALTVWDEPCARDGRRSWMKKWRVQCLIIL